MSKKGSTGKPVTTTWGKHLTASAKKGSAKAERRNSKEDVQKRLQENESSANNKFINFLESLKDNTNSTLIESVKKGFKACCENEEYSDAFTYAGFNNFELEIPKEAVADCSHQGQCDEDVDFWAPRITRPESITPELLRRELKGYGAWDEDELMNDEDNWKRIIWLAAGQIKDEGSITDGNEPDSNKPDIV